MASGFLIGVLLAIAGNTLIACALTLQKHTHNLEKLTGAQASSSPLFWFSIAGMIGGEVGNFAAFGFASPTVVSPLGAVAVIANGLLAALVLQEVLRVRNILGMALTIFGSVVVVLNAPPTTEDFSVEEFWLLLCAPSSIAYLVVLAATVVGLKLVEPTLGHKYLLINLMLCSTLGSVTVLCSSAFAKFLAQFLSGDFSVLTSPIVYIVPAVMGATAVLQLKFLNQAMGHFESSHVVPTYYVTFTICSISGGGVVLQDFWRFTAQGALGFCAGCALCFLGVGLITWQGTVAPAVADELATEPSDLTPRDRLKRGIQQVQKAAGVLGVIHDARLGWVKGMDVVTLGSHDADEPQNPALISGPAALLQASHPQSQRDLFAPRRGAAHANMLL